MDLSQTYCITACMLTRYNKMYKLFTRTLEFDKHCVYVCVCVCVNLCIFLEVL